MIRSLDVGVVIGVGLGVLGCGYFVWWLVVVLLGCVVVVCGFVAGWLCISS